MINVKNVLLAIFIAYFVMDITFAFLLKRKRPQLFQYAMNISKKERKRLFISIIIAIAAGAGAYYLAGQY
jgi:hypothetical protein